MPVDESGGAEEFPGRPYASVREAIRAADAQAIAPFLQSQALNPNERAEQNYT